MRRPKTKEIEEIVRDELISTTGSCICNLAYTSRGLEDPYCGWHTADGDRFPSDVARRIMDYLGGEA